MSKNTHSLASLQSYLDERILDQTQLTKKMLITLLSDGHLLVEGPPGLAKTTAISALAKGIHADFARIQFTPDLLPSDVTGTDIYQSESGQFLFRQGPIFGNLVLADEVNRAPAKVQSALLEAMSERQVSCGNQTHALPELFMVMATQNPIEQEGTYPLPEAQLDRFLLHVTIDYPDRKTEKDILHLNRNLDKGKQRQSDMQPLSIEIITQAKKDVQSVHMEENLEDYLVNLVMATRRPADYVQELQNWIRFGASPRATIALDRSARAHAWLHNRDYVTPEDIQTMVPDVLRHRVLLNFAAEASGKSVDQVVQRIMEVVPVP